MISISNTLINLNSKQGMGGNLQQELMSGSRRSLGVASMFITLEPVLAWLGICCSKKGVSCGGGGQGGVVGGAGKEAQV